MAHFGLRLGCWQRDCSATNGGPPELDHSNKGTGSSIRVDARWPSLILPEKYFGPFGCQPLTHKTFVLCLD